MKNFRPFWAILAIATFGDFCIPLRHRIGSLDGRQKERGDALLERSPCIIGS